MNILAIETSCDETSVSILQNGKILSSIVSSQIKNHQQFGGVIPELAARLHLKNISHVLKAALAQADVKITDITHIAYTSHPGLIGSLQIGKIAAETIASYLQIPLIGVNHLYGHIYGAAIEQNFEFPLIALLVSGGHTQLVYMKQHLDFEIIGSTLDDAIGECYDKVARMLNLDYPGGPVIDRLAKLGDDTKFEFPNINIINDYDLSFSGIKAHCYRLIKNIDTSDMLTVQNFCASFQKHCVKMLLEVLNKAISKLSVKMVVLAGGVSANSLLRESLLNLQNKDLQVVVPKLDYCTDNAAMIAWYAYELLKQDNKNKME